MTDDRAMDRTRLHTKRGFLALLAGAAIGLALPREADAQGRRRERRGGDDRRGRGDGGRGDERRQERGPPQRQYREDRGPPQRESRQPDMRRGGYMPPEYGDRVGDYDRYRLRAPPRGYDWRRAGDSYMMVDRETGRIYDVVPR